MHSVRIGTVPDHMHPEEFIMATIQTTLAREIGLCYAAAVRDEPYVRSVWIRPIRDYVKIWVETDPIDFDTEGRLYSAARVVDEQFPGVYFELSLANPVLFVPGTQMVGDVITHAALVYERTS